MIPAISGFVLLATYFVLSKAMPRIGLFKKFETLFSEIISVLAEYKTKWKVLLLVFLLCLVKWLLVSISFFVAFLAFGRHVPWPEIAIIPILSTFVGYIPISISGIGTVEYTAVYLFSLFEVESAVVVTVYFLLRFIQYFLAVTALLIFGFKNIIKPSK